MHYAIATVALEIDTNQLQKVRSLISEHFPFDGRADPVTPETQKIRERFFQELQMLHFFAIMIFEDSHYDPLLVMQVNVDGGIGPFWAAMEHEFGKELRALIRCSKKPRNREEPLWRKIVEEGSTTPIAPYLERKSHSPLTGYRGARRFSRTRILAERDLYASVQAALGNGNAWQGQTPNDVHKALRQQLVDEIPDPPPDPKPWAPSALDIGALATLVASGVLVVTFGLGGTALLASLLFWPEVVAGVMLVGWFLVYYYWQRMVQDGRPVPKVSISGKSVLLFLGGAGVCFLVLSAMAALLTLGDLWIFHDPERNFWTVLDAILRHLVAALLGGLLALALLFVWLRQLESIDATHDGVWLDDIEIKNIRRHEDWGMQNQMGSLLTVRPGVLRSIVLRVSHLLLSRLARTKFANGYLGPMRTIHFAHWAMLNRDGRLIFFSNFDGSWESYLNDFTEKASAGVNLAWSQCLGFPPNMYVVFGGSEQGRQFKTWARHSMAPTLFWFSAYPDLSVEMIHRNARVASGLARAPLMDTDAWARDL